MTPIVENVASNDHLSQVTAWLLGASKEVGEEHFFLPTAGGPTRYRERVYCYELYHRWRCNWTEGFHYSLCGEVDKRSHTLVKGKILDAAMPDMLVHVSGHMDNLLVMEIKPRTAKPEKMAKDLKKLTAFRRELVDEQQQPANYQAAFFWVYGICPDRWRDLRDRILAKVDNTDEVSLELIRCFVHPSARTEAVEVSW